MYLFFSALGFMVGYVTCAIFVNSKHADEVLEAHLEGVKEGKQIANAKWLNSKFAMRP